MAIYASIADNTDKVLTLTEADLEAADSFVDSCISRLGVNPEDVSPTPLLKSIALHYSLSSACIRNAASGDNTIMLERSLSYRRLYQDEVATLTKASLGLDTLPKGDWKTIPVFRGG